jgi:glucose-induced degradation protein 8
VLYVFYLPLTWATCRDINNLIMDYLITEGYPAAARKFATEANILPKTDFESINERVEIRDSIHKGDLKTAIEKINDLNPQVRERALAILVPFFP